MLDGRHTGTGGGNHLTLGGSSPADSPFLRRPDLLKSLIGYWLNHPSLSYLFSGVFIGPTSQAPRVDETRADAVYELELAFSLLNDTRSGNVRHGWWIEFSATFLSMSPATRIAPSFASTSSIHPTAQRAGSALSRCGLSRCRLMRRMSLAQQLLVRALVAWFWREPYEEGRSDGELAFTIFFCCRILSSRISTWSSGICSDRAIPSTGDWFAPHVEFRFPVHGRVCYEGVELELRQAIEPWYVLGEEPAQEARHATWIRPWSGCRSGCEG